MKTSTRTLISGIALASLAACSKHEDSQLAMCQALANQLTNGGIESFGDTSDSSNRKSRDIRLAYESAAGTGNIECSFPIDSNGNVATAPRDVTLNGERVGTRELVSAGSRASKELLKGVAETTLEEGNKLADEATDVARDVAERARETAIDVTETVQQQLQK